jgi:protein-S-isoprenylcysteine O-methyltransferase Ste14
MRASGYSWLLVTIQFGALAAIALTGPWFPRQPFLLVLQGVGVFVGLWAIVSIRPRDLNILPDPRDGAMLVRRGPYRYIRHPMYTGLLLATLPAVLAQPETIRVIAWLVLLADILIKLRHEERLLQAAFDEYAAYQLETKRLIPYVY